MKKGFFWSLVCGWIFFLAVAQVAQGAKSSPGPNPKEEYQAKKIWLAIPASAWIGFGVGEAIQWRYSDYGWAFTVADAAGFFLLASTFGDCAERVGDCTDRKNQAADTAKVILVTSRLAQIFDVSLWSYKYYERTHSRAMLLPQRDGAQFVLAVTF